MSRVRGDGSPTVTEHVVAAALASLPHVGPQRLRVLVNELGAYDAWRTIRGELPPTSRIAALFAQHDLGRVWRQSATDRLLEQIAESLTTSGMLVLLYSPVAETER